MPHMSNKVADQSAHPRNLISAFVFRCLDSIVPLLAIAETSRLQLASVVDQTGLSLTWLQTHENTFSRDVASFMNYIAVGTANEWTY